MDLYGRLVNKEELRQLKRTLTLESQEAGQLIPAFYSSNAVSMLEYFYGLQEEPKFRDTVKQIHKAMGGRGDAQNVIFFTTTSDPVVKGILFRRIPIPNIFEAKFESGAIISIKTIL